MHTTLYPHFFLTFKYNFQTFSVMIFFKTEDTKTNSALPIYRVFMSFWIDSSSIFVFYYLLK